LARQAIHALGPEPAEISIGLTFSPSNLEPPRPVHGKAARAKMQE